MTGVRNNPQVNNTSLTNHSDQADKAKTGKSSKGTSITRADPSQTKAIPSAESSAPDITIHTRKITATTNAKVDNRSPEAERFNDALNMFKGNSEVKQNLKNLSTYLGRLEKLHAEHESAAKAVDNLRRQRADDTSLCKEFMQVQGDTKSQIDKMRKKCLDWQNKFNGSVSAELKIDFFELEKAMTPDGRFQVELNRAQQSYEKYQQITDALLPKPNN